MITKLTNENYEQEVLQAKGTVVVDFYAGWCFSLRWNPPALASMYVLGTSP